MTDPFEAITGQLYDSVEADGVLRRERIRQNITDLIGMTRATYLSPDSRPHEQTTYEPDALEEALKQVENNLAAADETGMDIQVQTADSVNNVFRVLSGNQDLMEG